MPIYTSNANLSIVDRLTRVIRNSRDWHAIRTSSAAHSGITLLLVILILSSLLSISIGIFTSVFTELRISGEIADSFVALYAADEAIERGLYLDRNQTPPFCSGTEGPNCYDSGTVNLLNGACYRLRIDKISASQPDTFDVALRATGEFKCGASSPFLSVKRALRTDYSATY